MSEAQTTSQSEEVSEVTAAVVSLLVVGLGHILILDQTKRGGIWLGGSIAIGVVFGLFVLLTAGIGLLFFPVLLLIPVGSAIDAYMQAGKINAGEI